MATPVGKVLSVSVGSVREFEYGGRPARSAIWNSPAVGRIAARDKYLKQQARSVPTVWKPATGVPMANRKRSAVLPERRRSETGWAGPGEA